MRVRLLFAGVVPIDLDRIRVDAELRSLTESLRRSEFADRFHCEPRLAVRRRDLVEAVRDLRPHVVHFGGHGRAMEGLLIEDDAGRAEALSPADLVEILLSAGGVRLAVFNACESATYLETITRGAGCAIGPLRPLNDYVAIAFARWFYASIGEGASVAAAFDDALRRIHEGHLDDAGLQLTAATGIDPSRVVLAGEGSPLAPLDLSKPMSIDGFYK